MSSVFSKYIPRIGEKRTLFGVVNCCASGVLGVIVFRLDSGVRGCRWGVPRRLSSSAFCAMQPALLDGVWNPKTSLPEDSLSSSNCLDFLHRMRTNKWCLARIVWFDSEFGSDRKIGSSKKSYTREMQNARKTFLKGNICNQRRIWQC